MPGRFVPLALAGLATLALVQGAALVTPAPDEPWLVRWGRTAAAHPFRTSLALALLGAALPGLKRARDDRDRPDSPRDHS